MTDAAKKQIKDLIKNTIRQKAKEYSAETEYKPFFEALFSKENIQMGAIIQSLYTSFGMSVYEQISVVLAKDAGFTAEKQYTLKGEIDEETENYISTYWEDLKKNIKLKKITTSDKAAEIEAIKGMIKPGRPETDGDSTVDVYIKKPSGEEYYIDITTVKNNLKGFEVLKLKMLRWIALRASIDNEVNANSLIAIPYNPYFPNDYFDSRWNCTIIDKDKDILIQDAYWNFVGNSPHTYSELITLFKETGKELQPEIKKLFA